MHDATYWIERLGLARHPEGGYYREIYRSDATIEGCCLDASFEAVPEASRSVATSIYYLLPADEVSTLHRIRSDELWSFHAGAPMCVHVIDPDGAYRRLMVGLDEGASPQTLVRARSWFGATVADGDHRYALVGCVVAPGFDFADFELGTRDRMLELFPQHAEIVERLTART